jgi:hypothetical protein
VDRKLVFFNMYGNGDLFNSREFVKHLSNLIPSEHLFYAHNKNSRMFEDIPEIEYITPAVCPLDKEWEVDGDTLFINTWIGLHSSDVLPGIGCVVEKNLEKFNRMLREMGSTDFLTEPLLTYIPRVNFSFLNKNLLGNIDDFVKTQKRIVLISNGPAFSSQAVNFSMTPIIETLCKNYPEITFITTEQIEAVCPNLYNTHEVIESSDGFDINEICYLSKFADVIIGRSSGPYTCCLEYENVMDAKKTYIAFTFAEVTKSFSTTINFPAKFVWSPETEESLVYNVITGEL